MKIEMTVAVALALGLLLRDEPLPASLDANGPGAIKDYTSVDPASLGIKPLPAREDPETGFVVGGKNPTALIRKLTKINGRPIADLEADMRPGAFSTKGFLGKDEALLGVMAEDNRLVVEESGRSHRELAGHLLVLAAIGDKAGGDEFRYHGRRFRVELTYFRGFQGSPFRDGTETNAEAVVRNLDSGKEIKYSLLVPEMARRYGFYEGRGTPYRVDPREVLGVLDFLKEKRTPAGGVPPGP